MFTEDVFDLVSQFLIIELRWGGLGRVIVTATRKFKGRADLTDAVKIKGHTLNKKMLTRQAMPLVNYWQRQDM